MKQKFMASYDYETGGVWYVFLARSKEEILSKYSRLEVFDFDPPPASMSKETYDFIRNQPIHDIDDPPKGSLARFLK